APIAFAPRRGGCSPARQACRGLCWACAANRSMRRRARHSLPTAGAMIKGEVGILLTSIAPGTPAAMAKLQPGDVIIQVNQTDVKSAEEFSKLLGEAGSGEQVRFTIRRPAAPAPFSVPVTLGGSFSPMFERRIEMTTVPGAFFGLRRIGIQTMALTPRA